MIDNPTMGAATVRLATQEDWPAIRKLVRFAVSELEERFGIDDATDTLLPVISHGINEAQAVYVAEDLTGRIVGYVAWVGGMPGIPPKMALGAGTYVMPSYRGHGVSEKLRRQASEHCRRLGYRSIRGEAHKDNAAGIKSCEKLGFVTVAYVMELPL